jgi:hypothetical protein
VIFEDRTQAKRAMDGKITAIWRPASDTPYTEPAHPVQWRRPAGNEDPAPLRDRQAKTDKPVALATAGQVEIIKQEIRTLGSFTHVDARALGFMSLGAFRESLGDGWDDERSVWLVSFVVVRQEEDRPTWMRRGGGVTHDPNQAISKAEIPDRDSQRKVTQDARATFKLVKAEEELKRTAKNLGKLVREETLVSARAGVDVSDELAMIERTVKLIQAKRRSMDEAA